MKSKLFFMLLLTSAIMLSCNTKPKEEDPSKETTGVAKSENLKLEVYSFHSSHRCPSCNSIEENVKKVISSQFSDEVKNGEIAVFYLNIEDAGNKAIVEKLQVYGSSLFLIQFKENEEIIHDLTEYAFAYSRKQPEVFTTGLTDTIKSYIN